MFRVPTACCALLLLSAFSPVFCSESKEEKISVDQLPEAVKSTFLKEANGAVLSEFEREDKKEKVVYTAEMAGPKKGTIVELTVAEDGTLLSKETEDEDADEKSEHEDADEKSEHSGQHEN